MITFESQFSPTVNSIKAQIAEDIRVLDFRPDTVADFGCGDGRTTLALSILLHPARLTGIDNDQNVNNAANTQLSTLKPRLTELNIPLPIFIVGDVVTGQDLPSEVEFGYSRRLLGNVWGPFCENLAAAQQVLQKAICNISRSLSSKGWLIMVEESAQHNDYTKYLEEAGLFVQEKTTFTYSGTVLPMTRYVCRKQPTAK